MEEQLSSLAVTHLLQHTLRSLCIHENSHWVYAVFWRILPRNYPPPKWDCQGGAYDRSRGNRRNWILVWEDGFCNFAASSSSSATAAADHQINNINGRDHECPSSSAPHVYIGNSCEYNNNNHQLGGLQPELFFKMSHEIYNYGEGLIGKVAADHSHKWIHKEPNNQEINFLSAWHNSADSHPRTWEAQFQSGIKTIALIAVREGVIQLGAVQKVIEDLSYVVLLRKKFSYIESIPGVLLPHPSSSSTSAAYHHPFIKIDGGYPVGVGGGGGGEGWHHFHHGNNLLPPQPVPPPLPEFYDHHHNYHQVPMKITPSMSSLEALLSKLPSVVVPTSSSSPAQPAAAAYPEAQQHHPHYVMMGMEKVVAKEEFDPEDDQIQDQENDDDQKKNGDDDHDHQTSSSRVSSYNHHHHHHHPHPHFVSQESMHSHGY